MLLTYSRQFRWFLYLLMRKAMMIAPAIILSTHIPSQRCRRQSSLLFKKEGFTYFSNSVHGIGAASKCATNIQPTIQTVFVLFKEKSYDDGASHYLITPRLRYEMSIMIFLFFSSSMICRLLSVLFLVFLA